MSNVDLTTAFFAAVARSDLAAIQHLHSVRGVGIDIRDHVGRTPLHLAILAASFDVVQYLLSEGAGLGWRMKKGETVAHLAVMRGSVEILRLVMDTLRERQTKDGVDHLELEETPSEMKRIKVPVHVDSTMSSPKVSPLHLAVIYGHVELVRELVHTYGADVNLVVENKDPKATPLVLALSLDRNVCRSVAQSLLEHGAQITTPSINVLNLPTVSISEIDLFATYNPDNFFYALRECSYSNWRMYDTPLTGAIRMGREEIAVQLLTHGAPSQVDFDLTTSVDLAAPRRNLPQTARDRFCQPFLLAAVKEMPRVMQALLERGADPTVTLTEEQARDFPGYTDCRTALDIVRKKLAELRSWEEERLPQHLSNADELLQRKKEAIFSLTRDYEDVEISLVQAGVLVSEGLNLATLPTSGPERVSHKRHKTVAIQENHPESEDTPTLGINNIKSIEEGHAALLAAARRNDLATVKQLTLAHWGSNFEFSPIAVANIDKPPELSAFSAAATSGNYNLAKTIIFIAVVQHTAPSTVQYSIAKLFQNGEDVYSKLADHSFPTNAVQAVSKLVKNTITPMDMVLHCNFHLHNVVGRERNPELLKFAIQTRCLFPPMLKDLPFQRHIFGRGIEFGWTDVLEEQIRAMGSPFEHRIQDDKLVIGRALPREYQTAPLLQAARAGKLQVVQFFESEKSMDAYRQFAMTHTFDTRKKSLEKSREEFLGRVKTWFNQRRELVLHCAVISQNTETLSYLVSSYPELLNVKSADGWTPLMLAACVYNIEAVRILLAAGGDPFATDHLGRNMLHLVLVNPGGFTITFQSRDALRAILGLLDNSTRQTLLLQGSSEHPGNVTPLASWLYENCGFGWMPEHRDEVLSLILDASNESELEIQDGSGMMPLDIAVKFSFDTLVELLVKRNPRPLLRERARGMTLLEVAAEKRMLEMVEGTAARNFDRSMQRPATRYGGPLKDTPLSFFGEPSANSPRNAYTTWKICSTWARAYQSESIPRRQIATREEMEQIEEAAKTQKPKKPKKGGDEVSLAIYRPGDLY